MLSILNNFANGYIAIPVIHACRKGGLFDVLQQDQPRSFTNLVERLKANSGHLRVALNMLEGLNWVSRNSKNEFFLTSEAEIRIKIPIDIMSLMSFPMDNYVTDQTGGKFRLNKWFELSHQRWNINDSIFAAYLDGLLVIPLLLALKNNKFLSRSDHDLIRLRGMNSNVRNEIIEFFSDQNWLSQKKTTFSEKGRFIIDRILIMAIVASYKPMLLNLSEVIFSDSKSIFFRDQENHEQHLDRTLNVVGSGYQHEKYFSEMEEIVLSIFNREPFEQQPKYVADTGCGDGTLLKKIFDIIQHKSRRGKVLEEYPVKLIAIDLNDKALAEAACRLKGIDHIILKGDISNPEGLLSDLKQKKIQDVENIIHVRSFIDHDRPYIPPLDTSAAKARINISGEAVHVDKEGTIIPSEFVMQSLVEHFNRWSKAIGRHGLLLLEVHCLPGKIVKKYRDKCESLHFDTCHGFSQQLLVEAELFLMAAAEAGLFTCRNSFKRYPKTLPFTRITLNYLEKRDYRIRYAQMKDLPALEKLEQKCWEANMRTHVSTLEKRLRQHPAGHLIIELDNQLGGVIYSQRITNLDNLNDASIDTVDTLHNEKGTIIQLLGLNIAPEIQDKNLGDQLLEFMLQRCSLMNKIEKVIGVTRCKDYNNHNTVGLEKYIGLRNEHGKLVDTILRFHELHGAKVKQLMPNYRPYDRINQGYGVLIEYDVYNRQRKDIIQKDIKLQKKSSTENYKSVKDFIRKTIILILGKSKKNDFSLNRPLMEMGLDSSDLMELNEQICLEFQITLEPTFFFEHRTAERIIDYLSEYFNLEKKETVAQTKAGTIFDQRWRNSIGKTRKMNTTIWDKLEEVKEIAIVGMAFRLPGGIKTNEQLWELLTNGKDTITELPAHRWSWPDNIDLDDRHKGINYGGFLTEIDSFDAEFFRISPREAKLMDPQQRLLLELSWECFENSCCSAKSVAGSKTGVFIGVSGSDYNSLLNDQLNKIEAYHSIGTSLAALSNRISYFYDFHGPSLQIDTACSSSLAAIHAAVQSLKAGECEQALVGGVHIMCHPLNTIAYYEAGMLAKDGKCKTFDKEANGYVRGEGAVIMLLKPMKKVQHAQDYIQAVIKGSAINHGGQASGLTVPNPEQQANVIKEAFKIAQVEPQTVGYIEAHGTGTSIGDPIEINGLKEAFSRHVSTKEEIKKPYCGIGTIKTNIGHLEAAAGIAGLLKVILSMQHKMLPASLNFNQLNPYISLDKTPFYIVKKNKFWQLPEDRLLRRAGVSSFGSGGANAHVVVEEAPAVKREMSRKLPCYLICLSAKTKEALYRKEQDLEVWLEKQEQHQELFGISAALLTGRELFSERAAYVVKDIRELKSKLKTVLKEGTVEGYYKGKKKHTENELPTFFKKTGQSAIKELHASPMINEQHYIGKIESLAEFFARGYDLDWATLYGGEKIPYINLPTYPFIRKHYWISESDTVKICHDLKCSISKENKKEKEQVKLAGISMQSIEIDPAKPIKKLGQFQSPGISLTEPVAENVFNVEAQNQSTIQVETMQEELAESLAEILCMRKSDVDVEKNVVEMGLDSIIGVEWIRMINKQYKTSIQATKIYDYPTIQDLAGFLHKKLNSQKAEIHKKKENNLTQTKLEQCRIVQSAEISEIALVPVELTNQDESFKRAGYKHCVGEKRSESDAEKDNNKSIAIIGMSGRYPAASNLERFWKNMADEKNAIQVIPHNRWDGHRNKSFRSIQEKKVYCKWMGLLEDVEYFDPLFFNIAPIEAEVMDPQHRLFLQEGYKAFEDAGYTRSLLKRKKCGIYLGIIGNGHGAVLDQNQDSATNITANNYAIAAARISYYFDLCGPAISVDTACSSSLVATHLARQALLNHEIDMALVGGVSLYLTPELYINLCDARMLSPDGQCKAFDNSANGFVPGEGVGALVLKRLKDAENDNDIIYGTIIGSGINQDGRTNGITAPNGISQIELEREVYEKYNIHPESISYVEMHGTGTKLGDPIELEALSTVFKEKTQKKKYCAIGSVKSNIGHTTAAAGVASVHKVLLCMKNKKLVPTINLRKPNEHFNFEDSPFYVNTELRSWQSAQGIPRRASVSSFGISGTNAHIVIEEYNCKSAEKEPILVSKNKPIIFVLSAKTEIQLKVYAECIKNFIEKNNDINMVNMAYTLQIGREPMDFRLAFLAESREDILKAIEGFIGNNPSARVFTAQVKKSKNETVLFESDEDAKVLLKTWIQKKKLHKVAQLWVKGLNIEWNQLYGNKVPDRISMPTYPFSKERYWIKKTDTGIGYNMTAHDLIVTGALHPLLHQNISNLSGQRYCSNFTGKEYFLANHIINGRRVLSGAACLEMIRAAVDQSTQGLVEASTWIQLRNVIWARPIVVEDTPVKVYVEVFAEDNGNINYKVYSKSKKNENESVLHCQGMALFNGASEIPTFDLDDIQAQCSITTYSSAHCYHEFNRIGFEYGPGNQGIERIYIGKEQLLAKLSLPSSVSDTIDQYILHPSMIDAAFQASLMINNEKLRSALPFELEKLEIMSGCKTAMWALIRCTSDSETSCQSNPIDIDLCDGQGNLCVKMKGFTIRNPDKKTSKTKKMEAFGNLILQPYWKEQKIDQGAIEASYARHLVLLCEPENVANEDIESRIRGVHCITLKSERRNIEDRFYIYTVLALKEIQKLFNQQPNGNLLVQIIFIYHKEQQLFSGLSGLLKTAQLERPKFSGQLIEVEKGEKKSEIIEKIIESSKNTQYNSIRYRKDKRFVKNWREIRADGKTIKIPWKDQGVYLITGGAGKLGFILANDIAQNVKNARIILAGRSLLNQDKQIQLRKLEGLGALLEYHQVDVTQKNAVSELIMSIQEKFGALNGVIHCAGITRDNFILNKTSKEVQDVLAPKVTGLVNLDIATRYQCLDFFVLFSSIAGSLGNAGQADYACANSFMDAYVKYRNEKVTSKQRKGQTIAINWPLWKEGGIHIDDAYEQMMRQNTGMNAMQTSTGIRVLYHGLSANLAQCMVMEGRIDLIKKKLFLTEKPVVQQQTQATCSSEMGRNNKNLVEKIQSVLIKKVSKMLHINLEYVDATTDLSEYGYDSIALTEFANYINAKFKIEVTPALFFEHRTLQSFAEYLVKEHLTVLADQFSEQNKKQMIERIAIKNRDAIHSNLKEGYRRFAQNDASSSAEAIPIGSEPIAVIGMSGKFPMADDINKFWQNLIEGRDCITEIPKDRWDWREYYGEPNSKANKTNIKWGGFIDGIDEFDPLFFGISPLEAELIDPQQRLLMIYLIKAIEDAGYSMKSLSGTQTGIFVGTASSGYSKLLEKANIAVEGFSVTGVIPSMGPNRMSYFLNLHGPSEPVETACSSSLVAIHRAVGAINNGTCEMTIAGGVNTIVTPEAHISFNKAGMLCKDGRCKTFSENANGYVRGEGVGMLVLKKLKNAQQDGDHIYGVIRSTAVNHGGRTNSLTAPNPKAQAKLLKTAYVNAGIDPRTITYIEAHGTGTKLGDPIEINGLKSAFRELFRISGDTKVANAYCGIGSVKSNIGHLELAAGIAGVIKVLLQFKHQTLVKSLHCNNLNPYIQLSGSPFYIVQDNMEWENLTDAAGKDIPRRAGVSSFGFGGVNAHVVIEEYVPMSHERNTINIASKNPVIMVLSAKNEEQLKEQARQLLKAIKKQQHTDYNLSDIAYTLQVGRDEMEERLGFIAASIEEVKEKLLAFLKGTNDIAFYRGKIEQKKESLNIFTADEEIQEVVDKYIQGGKYTRLLNFWMKGLCFDWNKLYGDRKPKRISLPTYPFAKERCWVPETCSTAAIAMAGPTHPLLHENISSFLKQNFSTTFTGQEFFLADHVINNQIIMPAVIYLEMIRAAVKRSVADMMDDQMIIRLKNVVWARRMAIDNQSIRIHTSLRLEDNDEISFEIYDLSKFAGAEPVVYCQGRAILSRIAKTQILDFKKWQSEDNLKSISPDQCYQHFKTMGIDYGPGYRGIEKMYVKDGQVLAKLSLPDCVSESQRQFVLHPTLMDSSLQALIGLMIAKEINDNEVDFKPVLPFALQELSIFDKCTSSMWALVRYHGGGTTQKQILKLDIDLYDEQGKNCVQMSGISLRRSEDKAKKPETSGKTILQPVWKEQVIDVKNKAPEFDQHLVMVCESSEYLKNESLDNVNGMDCRILKSEEKSIEKRFCSYAVHLFDAIQSILKNKTKSRVLVQIVVSRQGEQQLFYALYGLLITAQLENPKIFGQLIEIEEKVTKEKIIEILKENKQSPMDIYIRYQNGKRLINEWCELETSPEKATFPWKNQGVYLITGGAGGLGLLFAKEIARQVKNAILILTGRTKLNADKLSKLEEIKLSGTQIEYKEIDVTQKEELTLLIKNIRKDFGDLNGIIHAAGVIRDGFIFKKNKNEFKEVLAPKVDGLVNLDQACKGLRLDFFILFSSITAVIGNIGQADYAAANAFMDAYAVYRNTLVAAKQRWGHTLSVNWPLWKNGGLQIDEETEKQMRGKGIMPMPTKTGITALYEGMTSRAERMMVVNGDVNLFYKQCLKRPEIAARQTLHDLSKTNEMALKTIHDDLKEKAVNYFKRLFSSVIKLPEKRFEAAAPLEKYGIDSVMVIQLTNQLERMFGSLSKTLLYEYQTLNDLTDYFLEVYWDRLANLLENDHYNELDAFNVTEKKSENKDLKSSLNIKKSAQIKFQKVKYQSEKTNTPLDIAIIGVAGRYPEAKNIQEFWKNLQDGKDCITEIPKNRWNYSLYFDEYKDKDEKKYSKLGGFIDGVDQFDPSFFNISPREAKSMDPQERLFLECVYQTLEDAGYSREQPGYHRNYGLGKNVGVYVGVMYEEYQLYGAQEQMLGRPVAIAGSPASIANRVSFFFNLNGPSMSVDTMCSSSLTAIHLACQSLMQGDCETAIAGGVNISIHPNKYLMLSRNKFISTNGRCKSFGQGGDGYVPGEGVGAVLLKPLAKAITDRDHIYGVIKATAINHGGTTNGYTVPNPNAQAGVIEKALRKAGIDPRTISYIEAHGTGTMLGDPIEITGLTKTFQKFTEDKQFCAIGSVKSNIGHCESAAGIAAVTKVLLQMQHRQLVPSLHSKVLNPYIDFNSTPFIVQQENEKWERPVIEIDGKSREYPRIAGVSSFGAGGSNAYIVLEEYISRKKNNPALAVYLNNPSIIVLSAKDHERLKEKAKQLKSYIKNEKMKDGELENMAYTLQVGREAMEMRMGMIVGSIKELEEKLDGFVKGKENILNLYRGKKVRNKETLDDFKLGKKFTENITKLLHGKKYRKLLQKWVDGMDFDWNRIHRITKPSRMSLPTYPFDKKRYWISETKKDMAPASNAAAGDSIRTMMDSNSACHLKTQSDKPRNILLPPIIEVKNLFENTAGKNQQAISSKKPSVCLPQTECNSKSGFKSHDQAVIKTVVLHEELSTSLAEVLDMDKGDIDIDENFNNMGLDSVFGVDWIQEVNKRYGISVKATQIYNYPTVREFAKYLKKELNHPSTKQSPEKSDPPDSLSEFIQQVQQGMLSVEQAKNHFTANFISPNVA